MNITIKENIGKAFSKFIGDDAYQIKNTLKIFEIIYDTGPSHISSVFNKDFCTYESVNILPPSDELIINTKTTYDIIIFVNLTDKNISLNKIFVQLLSALNDDGYFFLVTGNHKNNNTSPTPSEISNLSKLNHSRIVDHWFEKRGKDNEVYSIIRKTTNKNGWDGKPELELRHSLLDIPTHLSGPISPASEEEEKTRGKIPYLSFFDHIHKKISPQNYLEIGIRHGRSLAQAKCPSIGIDPTPDIKVTLENTIIYPNTSDDFFENIAPNILKNNRDLIFIDGMHLFEYALRDFINCELYSHESTLIIIDDIFPCHPRQALRKRDSQVWTGDVWKLIPCLKHYRPDLAMIAVDTSPTGLLLIINTSCENQTLNYEYNEIIDNFIYKQDPEPPESIISRQGIIDPDNNSLNILLNSISNGSIKSDQACKIIEELKLK
ncbi:class I SAM-dependent methyltransferase [Oceanicoccus sp. KOV_DT_Chl]|uniref:class I SAM-dependent methyltransferase n=1 Tax=Oceanicoccus sp. KOV_DT_Chl TaxID=1904639 RepID=UPI000C7E1CD9|nr:class I SAM-dependent methyltransferase [Oceanicoccus sp. KOV_DT_Chl]